MGEWNGDERTTGVGECRPAGHRFECGFREEADEQQARREREWAIVAPPVAGERDGSEEEEGGVDAAQAAIRREGGLQDPERQGNEHGGREQAGEVAEAIPGFAESAEQDEGGEGPGEMVVGPMRKMAGEDTPRLMDGEVAIVLKGRANSYRGCQQGCRGDRDRQ
ncbi:MAG TPA: hypothetical protein VGI81_10515 [Tepidisphaeraceae bacterium]|jgi:hypothetical protein